MIAIVTGDIINSRAEAATKWQPVLKKVLNRYGKTPKDWELYRGDSFQLGVRPEKAFIAALHIKSAMKQMSRMDVRMSVGIGTIDTRAAHITAATGSAFIRSGEAFDTLKKQTLLVATGDEILDETLNLMINLALLTMNNWSESVAQVIKACIENPEKTRVRSLHYCEKHKAALAKR